MTEKTDWSFVTEALKRKKGEKEQKTKVEAEKKEKIQQEFGEELAEANRREYEKAKKDIEDFIRKHPTDDLEERLRKAEIELKKKFGIK